MSYNPARPIPQLTPAYESIMKSRLDELKEKDARKGMDDFDWWEVQLIEAILAATTRSPLKTLGEAYQVIYFRIRRNPRVQGWSATKAEEHLAMVADDLFKLFQTS